MGETFTTHCPPLPNCRWIAGRFAEPLSPAAFGQLLDVLFGDWRLSGLWGKSTRLGPTKAHVYGVDTRSWQPCMLELTGTGYLAGVSEGDPEEIARAVEEAARSVASGAARLEGER